MKICKTIHLLLFSIFASNYFWRMLLYTNIIFNGFCEASFEYDNSSFWHIWQKAIERTFKFVNLSLSRSVTLGQIIPNWFWDKWVFCRFYTLWPIGGGGTQQVLYAQDIVAMIKWNLHVDRLKHYKNMFSLMVSVGEFNQSTNLKKVGKYRPVEIERLVHTVRCHTVVWSQIIQCDSIPSWSPVE